MRVIPEEFKLNSYEIIMTWDCNLRCVYCYECQPDKTTTALRQTNKEPLSSGRIDEILDFIVETHDKHVPELNIIFWGGEPFLAFEQIKELIAKFEQAQAAGLLKTKATYTTTSNLTTLTLEQMQYLQTKPFSILVSLDGLPESTDGNRGRGTFAQVIRNMALLEGLRIPFSVRMTLTGEPAALKKDLDFVNELGHPFWWCFDHAHKTLTPADLEQILPVFLDFYRKHRVNHARTLDKYLGKKNNKTHCIDPYYQVTIDPEGQLRICSRVDWIIGNIQEGFTQYAQVKELPFYTGRPPDTCADCLVYECCKGGCIGAHFEKNPEKALNYRLNDSFCKEMFLMQLLNENLILGQQYNELKKETEEALA
ncbi:MAG: 4Fe-4S cluster-binding domain-containing protein [Candidatus Margulisbacteria bacterium]|jgi:uncharacterized protein|nr:4Fe-4S cluster-binding domain-containing protein [Candidatus Margulisiibacteriota bacterium]